MGRIDFRQSEVENLGVTALGDEEVRGFDVPVDDSLGVGSFQSIGCLDGKIHEFVGGDDSWHGFLSFKLSPSSSSITITGR